MEMANWNIVLHLGCQSRPPWLRFLLMMVACSRCPSESLVGVVCFNRSHFPIPKTLIDRIVTSATAFVSIKLSQQNRLLAHAEDKAYGGDTNSTSIQHLNLIPMRRVSGPPGLPFIGNLHQIDGSSLHTSLWNLTKPYGPIASFRLGFNSAVVVSSASLAKEVLKTQDNIFCGRPSLISQQKLTYGGIDMAFSPYNEHFKDMRKIFNLHLFNPKRVRSFQYIREDEVSSAMKTIHDLARSNEAVNLSQMMKNLASVVMMRMGFGNKRYQDELEKKKVVEMINEVQGHLVDLYVADIWPGLPFVGLVDRLMGKTNRLEKCFGDLDSFYQQLIDERLDPKRHKSYEKDEDDVIDILLRLDKDRMFNLTHKDVKAMLMDLLVAGTDTSAAIVVWAMTLLIRNPKVMQKAQQEVRNLIGKNGEIDEDNLSKLSYLKAVIKETLRLYPPAPLLVPRETREDTIIHGYQIKQKTLVYVNAWAIGRDPESWDNPEEFLPERFLGGSDIDFKGNNFELIPFGAGRRICPGMSIGVVLVELLLANLLYLFNWELPDGVRKEDIDFEVMPGITMHKKNELCLLAHVYI